MLLQDKNKSGVSLMVSYILLVVFAVVIGAIVFAWLRTYVPSQGLSCPDGTSVFIKESSFNDSTLKLNLILRNSGRFDIAGYFIQATNNSEQEVATIDLSAYLNESFGEKKFGNSVVFVLGQNAMGPGDTRTNIFDIPSELGDPYSVNIIPTRYQVEDNRQRFVSCSEARVQNLVGAPGEECVPETISETCGTWICGNRVNNCGQSVSCAPGCIGGEVCDATGSCIPPAQCTDTCSTYSYQCGTQLICGISTNCGTCNSGFSCNTTGQCVANCGNGIIDTGETCDDGDTVSGDGCSASCTIESGFTCSGEPSTCTAVASCPAYCVSLNYGTGSCTNSPGNCQSNGGVYQSGGNQWCTGGSQADTCCCFV